ncbi:MAG: hypothetical protein OEZ22_02905 [Spirochaetia bacterium]|nr:hypothetical protein [Spirochaetia bacterium]
MKKLFIMKFSVLFFILLSQNIFSLSYNGRIDTSYKLKYGDNAFDHDIFQYYGINSNFNGELSFVASGVLRKDIDGKNKFISTKGADISDAAFWDISDARNKEQNVEFLLSTAYLKYSANTFEAQLGRMYLYDYSFLQVDGLKAAVQPFHWIYIEAFGGKPWHFENDYAFDSKEVAAGIGSETIFFDHSFLFNFNYLYLKELTYEGIYPVDTESNYEEPQKIYFTDHYLKAKAGYNFSKNYYSEISSSYLTNDVKDANIFIRSFFPYLVLESIFSYYVQLLDVENFGNRLNSFSTVLSASSPYHRISLDINKDVLHMHLLSGYLNEIFIFMRYEYRLPFKKEDISIFNPEYHLVRLGTTFASEKNYILELFGEGYLSKDNINDNFAFGGEFARQTRNLKIAMGTGFFIYKYETYYGTSIYKDSINAREYYLELKYKPLNYLDFRLKGSIETSEQEMLSEALVDKETKNINASGLQAYYKLFFNAGVSF